MLRVLFVGTSIRFFLYETIESRVPTSREVAKAAPLTDDPPPCRHAIDPQITPFNLYKVLLACLRIDDGQSFGDDDWVGMKESSSIPDPRDEARAVARTNSGGTPATTRDGDASLHDPAAAAMVGLMGGADAKAEELAMLTGAPIAPRRESASETDNRAKTQDNENSKGSAEVLELRGSAWEHVGLPRERALDILVWAQRQVSGNSETSGHGAKGVSSPLGGYGASGGGTSPRTPGASRSKERANEEVAAERLVASLSLGILHGLLAGEIPRGFAASVVSSCDSHAQDPGGTSLPQPSSTFGSFMSAPSEFSLDAFFSDPAVAVPPVNLGLSGRPASSYNLAQGISDGDGGGGAGGRSSRNDRGFAEGSNRADGTFEPFPLVIRLPEAFPALCSLVATAPEGAVARVAVIKMLIGAAHAQQNARAILSVGSWQQYLLSIISSSQGRQAVAGAQDRAAIVPPGSSFGEASTDGQSMAPRRTVDGDAGGSEWEEQEGNADGESSEEERLVDQTVRLLCWLAMCEAQEGGSGRPGAGFSGLHDTMSFLRCQAELGAMECVSIGELILHHMVRMSDDVRDTFGVWFILLRCASSRC